MSDFATWYGELVKESVAKRRRNWRPRVRRAIEEADAAIYEHTRGPAYICVDCSMTWLENEYPSTLSLVRVIEAHEKERSHSVHFKGPGVITMPDYDLGDHKHDEDGRCMVPVPGTSILAVRPWPRSRRDQAVPMSVEDCPEIHGVDDIRRGIVCEVCGYGRSYFPADGWVEIGLIALAVVLALLALATFGAPALLGR